MKNIYQNIMNNKLYSRWHKNKYHTLLHWSLLLLVGFFTVQYISSDVNNFFDQAIENTNTVTLSASITAYKQQKDDDSIKQLAVLNRDLLNASNKSRNTQNPQQKTLVTEELKKIAENRKNSVLSAMKNNPSGVIASSLNPQVINNVAPEVRNLIEQQKTIRGRFEYLHVDREEADIAQNKASENIYHVIEDGSNKKYRVYMSEEMHALTDDTVEVTGLSLDDNIATTKPNLNIIASPQLNKISRGEPVEEEVSLWQRIVRVFSFGRMNEAVAQTTVNKRKTAVIMFNWQNDTRTTFTEASARGTYFTNANSASNFFKENSFGKVELTGKNRVDGDVYGWVTIPYDNTNCSSNWSTWASAAETQLRAQGVDLSGYNIRSYVFPSNSSCGWGGLGYVGGENTTNWVNGTSLGIIIHEIGHNLGSQHAGSWSCSENGVRVSTSTSDSNCTLAEYGDVYSVMGNPHGGRTYHFNNYHKTLSNYSTLNWIPSINTATVDRNTISSTGTYTLTPIEYSSTGTQAIRIPRLKTSTGSIIDYYFLEFRQPFGWDSTINTNATNGVSIRVGSTSPGVSRLIDTTPSTTSFADAPLSVGKTFSDKTRAVDITTVSTSKEGAVVKIAFGAQPCTNTSPSISISPTSQSTSPGNTLSYGVTVTNNDSSGCAPSRFSVTATLPTGFLQSPTSFTTSSLNPGARETTIINITSPASVTPSNYTFTQRVVHPVNTVLANTVTGTFGIQALDTTAPVVRITSPANNSTVPSRGNLQISTSVTDSSPISNISINFNGNPIKTCNNTTSCSVSYKTSRLAKGSHTITVVATDSAGNKGNSSVTVIK